MYKTKPRCFFLSEGYNLLFFVLLQRTSQNEKKKYTSVHALVLKIVHNTQIKERLTNTISRPMIAVLSQTERSVD